MRFICGLAHYDFTSTNAIATIPMETLLSL